MSRRSLACFSLALIGTAAVAATAQTPSMAQDPALDNLVHPAGYPAVPIGTLGDVVRVGTGPRSMILIPGIGFGGEVFDEFMARRADRFTMRAVTLPGFAGTEAPEMPAAGASYAATPWTDGATTAILELMDQEKIARATLVAHWALGSQIAIRLAASHPERFDALILIAGVPRAFYQSIPGMATWTPDQRVKYADVMAERWFKTVTRRTWDDNNFMSYDYAVNPRRGLFLWRQAAEPTLPVWIRYLLEFYAADVSAQLGRLSVPTLVVQPGFDDPGFYVEGNRDYMRDLCHRSWDGVTLSSAVETVQVPGARLFVMYDQPEELDRVIQHFLDRHPAVTPGAPADSHNERTPSTSHRIAFPSSASSRDRERSAPSDRQRNDRHALRNAAPRPGPHLVRQHRLRSHIVRGHAASRRDRRAVSPFPYVRRHQPVFVEVRRGR